MTQREKIEALQKASDDMWNLVVKQYEIYEDLEYFYDRAILPEERKRIDNELGSQMNNINESIKAYGVVISKINELCK